MAFDIGTTPARPKSKLRDDEFYISFITFEVEGILFRVPRRPFEIESETFRGMFTLPPTEVIEEGSSDDHPLILDGISATDFRALVKALLCPAYGSRSELNETECISVLRLARLWNCDKLFDASTNALDKLSDNLALKISLAKKYHVPHWLKTNYFALVMRLEPLTVAEAEMIGTECVLKLTEIRESRYKWALDGYIQGLWKGTRKPRPSVAVPETSPSSSSAPGTGVSSFSFFESSPLPPPVPPPGLPSLSSPRPKLSALEIGLDPEIFRESVDASYAKRLKAMVLRAIIEAFDLD